MPKLSNRPPKYSQFRRYAVVYHNKKRVYLGLYGSPESHAAYNRFLAGWQANPVFIPVKDETDTITISELAAAFLEHAKATMDDSSYGHYRTIVADFLFKLYGDDTSADSFSPRNLKLVRTAFIQSKRFCRNTINKHVRRIVTMFTWGVEQELVDPNVPLKLKSVKHLKAGPPDTFENEIREDVPDDVIIKTLPFMPPTVAAMVQVQRLTGMRPSEVFKMQVSDIDKTRNTELWYYTLDKHKTERFVGKKVIPLGKPEQALLAPYLKNKLAEQAVFSPRQAVEERNAERKANRKTKITPSQAARNKARAVKPKQYAEFYTKHTYYRAIEYAIKKGNKTLQGGEKIPHWYPYQIRHAAGTATEKAEGLDKAQALLGHKTANVTRRYAHSQLAIAEDMARNRQNPFELPKQSEETKSE